MGWRFDLGKLEPEHRAIVMKKDEEEKRRREEETKRKTTIQKVDSKEISPIFNLIYAGTNARAQEINGVFVVLKGSLTRKTQTNNLAESTIHIREKLIQDGILIKSQDNDFWIFSQNVPFQDPSIAAKVVCGASLNGRQYWKIQDTSQSYTKWSKERIEQ
jgi:hypothetical protein